MSLEVHQTLKVFHAQLNDVESTNNLQIKNTCWRNSFYDSFSLYTHWIIYTIDCPSSYSSIISDYIGLLWSVLQIREQDCFLALFDLQDFCNNML